MLDVFPTPDQLSLRQIQVPHSCCYCWTRMESRNHLFFECHFTFYIWKTIANMCHTTHKPRKKVKQEPVWVAKAFKGGGNIGELGKLAFCAAIAHIWQEIKCKKTREAIIMLLESEILARCHSIKWHARNSAKNAHLPSNWNVCTV
ncbi:hypothetical protein NE237_033311 [Protea cynaroides]|uniref:Reverse transcriptase zinc-binding domain-containing protein n=1 Tax=Protea cynaroides TaxID=273540 RepID=A0A9Q0L537_9MAGN|nr:hypothetical protein NE237_033311 [Protea cynaroides]